MEAQEQRQVFRAALSLMQAVVAVQRNPAVRKGRAAQAVVAQRKRRQMGLLAQPIPAAVAVDAEVLKARRPQQAAQAAPAS